MNYYLQLKTSSGTVNEQGYTWFTISDLSFTTTYSTGSSPVSGQESFGTVSFTIDPGLLNPLLLTIEGQGDDDYTADIVGYKLLSNQEYLQELDLFQNAYVSALTINADGTETVSLSYSALNEQTYGSTPTNPLLSAGWNVSTAAPDNVTAAAPSSFASVQTAPTATTPLTYYVQFRNASGVALTDLNGNSWFAVTAVSFGSTGHASSFAFGSVAFTLAGNEAFEALFLDQAQGTVFGQVELAGYDTSGATPVLAQDTVFKNATIAALVTTQPGTVSVAVTMTYEAQVESDYASNDGQVAGNTAGLSLTNTVNDTATVAAPETGAPAVSSAPPGTGDYVQFKSAANNTLSAGGDTWFQIDNLSFSTAYGQGGQEIFSEVTFTVGAGPLASALLTLEGQRASGYSAEIVGYSITETTASLYQLDLFENATIAALTVNYDGTETVSLTYSDLHEQTYNGTTTTPIASVGWNAATSAVDSSTVTAPGSYPQAQLYGALGVNIIYAIQFRSASGAALTSPDGNSWFSALYVSFAANSNPAGSKLSFSDVSFTLAPGEALPALFLDQAEATVFGQVELAGYSSGNLIQDTVFKNATITDMAVSSDGAAILTLSYDDEVDTGYAVLGGGNRASTTGGWNDSTDAADDTATIAAPQTSVPTEEQGINPQLDFLQLTSPAGTVTEDGTFWFEITDVSFSTSYSSGAGGESFGTMSFTIDSSLLTPALLAIEGQGNEDNTAEIVGYSDYGPNYAEELYQLDLFNDAWVSGLTTNTDGTETVSINYGDLHQQIYDGTSTTPVANAGWNAMTSSADNSIVIAPRAAAAVTDYAAFEENPLAFVHFIQFRASNGAALTSPTGNSWFLVTSVSFGSTSFVPSGSEGRPELVFGSLSFTLEANDAMPTLLLDEAEGTQFGQVELADYHTASPDVLEADTVFGDATITGLTNDSDGNEGSITVTMSYDAQVDLATIYPDENGAVTTTEGWSTATKEADDTATFAAPKNQTPEADNGFDTIIACFCAGTRVRTGRGAVKVEDLVIGDQVETLHAGLQKIKWIGWRSYDGRFIAGNKDVLPICIKRHAIAKNVPARDLFVSPGHAICIDGALIHAFRLVNGVSITQAASVETVTYYHIETEGHEVIFAENCPAETFMDEDFRAQFQNAADYHALYPSQGAARFACLPRLDDGFLLDAIQRRLAARANIVQPVTHGPLRGYVDAPGPDICAGWAQDLDNPETPVRLDIIVNGTRVARVLANIYRPDLRQAGLGSGFHGFHAALPGGCAGPVEVRRAIDATELPWAPTALALAA